MWWKGREVLLVGKNDEGRMTARVTDINLEQKKCKLYDTLEIKDVYAFSIAGEIRGYRAYTMRCWGQITHYIDAIFKNGMNITYSRKLGKDRVLRLLKLWDNWYLNDLITGTDKQMEILSRKGADEGTTYEEQLIVLRKHNLEVDRGYRYGTSWLCKQMNDSDVEFIKEVIKILRDDST